MKTKIKITNKIDLNLILSCAVCLVPFIMSLTFFSRMPEQIAIHFNFNGEPDSYAPKFFAAFIIPSIVLLVHLYIWFRVESDPKKANMSVMLKHIFLWCRPFVSIAMQAALISYALGSRLEWNFYVLLFLGILFIVTGNYLPKCRQNYTMGIRLPWTLNNQDNWNRTHRVSGYIWIICGTIYIINAFINIEWLTYAVFIALVAFPVAYSYCISKNTDKNDKTDERDLVS